MNINKCKIGVIGFGLRAEYVVKNFAQYKMPAEIVSICDSNIEGVKERLQILGIDEKKVNFYDDLHKMMINQKLDGVMIATNCESHTDIACEVMKYQIPMFLEKPVCITEEQLEKLSKAEKEYTSEALVSFPLRVSPICQKVKQIIDSGILGKISQIQATNNVPYARVYFHSWYRDESLTGGLFLQKATHDIDVIQYLIKDVPVVVSAMESKTIFKGNKPAKYQCPTCEDYLVCSESSYVVKNKCLENVDGEGCAFAVDTGNHDSATILMQYANGVHSFYTQNFVARKEAGTRCIRIIGYNATIEFDFSTSIIKLFHHHKNITETICVNVDGMNHFGGDKALAENFIEIMRKIKKSEAPLISGIESARACLMAKRSANENVFVKRTI